MLKSSSMVCISLAEPRLLALISESITCACGRHLSSNSLRTNVAPMSEPGEVQDAVSFLEDARCVYPNVSHLLNKVQLLALDMDAREPFSKGSENEEFVKVAEAFFITKLNCDLTRGDLRAALMEPRAAGKPLDVSEKESVIQCLEMVSEFDFARMRNHRSAYTSLSLSSSSIAGGREGEREGGIDGERRQEGREGGIIAYGWVERGGCRSVKHVFSIQRFANLTGAEASQDNLGPQTEGD